MERGRLRIGFQVWGQYVSWSDLMSIGREIDRLETSVQIVRACLLERLGPERVEILGRGGHAAVLAQFVEGKVEQGHQGPPS